jgi:transposase
MMTKLLVYGYCVGVYSGRKMQRKLSEDVAFRVLWRGESRTFGSKTCRCGKGYSGWCCGWHWSWGR